VIELSEYVIEALAKDKEFNLYRGRIAAEIKLTTLTFWCFHPWRSIPRRKL